jgi:carbamoyl-phosphate synthase small subunit
MINISTLKPAVLVLQDGSIFEGFALGALGCTVGEVVFNTAMTGYQEILTDPSYARQLITLTVPHVGNVGINQQDMESGKVFAAGLIIHDVALLVSNWRSEMTLDEFLTGQGIVAITGIDTRMLTRKLRDQGAMHGCILSENVDSARALTLAQAFPGLSGMDLAKEVTTPNSYEWRHSVIQLGEPDHEIPGSDLPYHVVVYDYGVKRNILRLLVNQGCRLTVVPAQTSAADVLALQPDGIFLSNGPGDPAACDYAIAAIQTLLDTNIPIFGICLGFQLLALASGGHTQKMKFGHHGANHPILNCQTGRVAISSQNHGFAVVEAQLPPQLEITARSLFDGTIQGIRRTDKPVFAFQGHPEASPGPHDLRSQFNDFIQLIQRRKNNPVTLQGN